MNWCQYILFRLFLFSCSDVQENTDISLTRINMSIKMAAQSYTKRLVLRELELIKYNEFNISLI